MDTRIDYLARLLQSCNTHHSIHVGKQLHLHFLKKGILNSTLPIANRLLQMYMRCGNPTDALLLFDEMPLRNCFSWNAMIEGFMKLGHKEKSLQLFNVMPQKNDFSWNMLISGFAKADLAALEYGKQIHSHILVNGLDFDSVLGSSLVNLYGKCGDFNSANQVLNMMKEPDDFCLSALISGYANCGKMNDARRVFDRTTDTSSVMWNSMISGYISNNEDTEALLLFHKMRRNGVLEDASTLASVLSACSSLGFLEHGKQVHGHACKVGVIDDVIVASALLDTYSKCGMPSDACKLFSELKVYDTILLNTMITVYSSCGRIEDAKHIFRTMPNKSLISWNSMIVGLSQNGSPIEALDLFCNMNKLDLRMDKFSLASVISACANISSLELGEQVFARVTIIGLDSDQIISTSLVDFYCKCGYEALALFNEMRNTGVKPTIITFTAILSACDHCGLVKEGQKWFDAMKWQYHIDPEIEHYSCMVDLFARAGCLNEAVNLIEQMPFEADVGMWSSILRGCVAHGDKGLGRKVAERMIELDPENACAYIQLSSIFATSGEWEKSSLIRDIMREKHVGKLPGCSWADGTLSLMVVYSNLCSSHVVPTRNELAYLLIRMVYGNILTIALLLLANNGGL
ncbi:hypothetical protein CUMW_138940 [Citrus unshiu]|uniref:Pentacotripeptide-repeat region of PRORP domain-containing protein n=1 Tax=Citrus unshiu TaxID=55188 RepID=A0A2H5PI74_CITUN|nr:hypothetical protein CUMW_138940 [Citrus unshiu]